MGVGGAGEGRLEAEGEGTTEGEGEGDGTSWGDETSTGDVREPGREICTLSCDMPSRASGEGKRELSSSLPASPALPSCHRSVWERPCDRSSTPSFSRSITPSINDAAAASSASCSAT